MNSRDFAFWLQGFFELNQRSDEPLDSEQVKMIKEHLDLVFKHDIGKPKQAEPFKPWPEPSDPTTTKPYPFDMPQIIC